MDGEKAPLHSSAVRPQLQATTIGLAAPPPASSELRGEVIPARDSQPGSLWACFCPECLPSRSFLLASALAPPFASLSSPRPLVPGQPPAASPSGKQHLPQTYSLSRQSTERPPTPGLSPSRALSGPESGSAEVPGPATPALSRERGAAAVSDSTSGLDHLRQDRGGRAERCSDLRGDFTLGRLGLRQDLSGHKSGRDPLDLHAYSASAFSAFRFGCSLPRMTIVQPDLRLGTKLGQAKPEKPDVSSGGAPLSSPGSSH